MKSSKNKYNDLLNYIGQTIETIRPNATSFEGEQKNACKEYHPYAREKSRQAPQMGTKKQQHKKNLTDDNKTKNHN